MLFRFVLLNAFLGALPLLAGIVVAARRVSGARPALLVCVAAVVVVASVAHGDYSARLLASWNPCGSSSPRRTATLRC